MCGKSESRTWLEDNTTSLWNTLAAWHHSRLLAVVLLLFPFAWDKTARAQTADGFRVSVGMSLNMMADILLGLGSVEAMNLDGGFDGDESATSW